MNRDVDSKPGMRVSGDAGVLMFRRRVLSSRGCLFVVLLIGVFRVLSASNDLVYSHQFAFDTNINRSPVSLTVGRDGMLYGTTMAGGAEGRGIAFALKQDGTGFRVLKNFQTNGLDFAGPLMEASDGVLYGTGEYGGSNGMGCVFRLHRDGSGYALLRSFRNQDGEPRYPKAALVEGPDGMLYGTTRSGGSGIYNGTVFKLGRNSTGCAVLHSFGSVPADGENPYVSLVSGSDGLLYGITPYGGSNGAGTVFRLDANGDNYAILRSFQSRNGDAGYPDALIEGSDGRLYGSSGSGGSTNCGAVFSLQRDGDGYSVLWSVTNCSRGNFPIVTLAESEDGWLYGATGQSGVGYGTLFRLRKDGGDYAELWRFAVANGDGKWPTISPVLGSAGDLYGVTRSPIEGIIFRLGLPQRQVILQQVPEGFGIRFGGVPGRSYELHRTVDFTNWTVVAEFTAPLLPFAEYRDSNAPGGRAFYRSLSRAP